MRITKAACLDESNLCPYWAEHGECEVNPDYMLRKCPMSCKICTEGETTTGNSLDSVVEVGIDGGSENSIATGSPRKDKKEIKNILATAEKTSNGGIVVTVSHELEGEGEVGVVWLDDGKASGQSAELELIRLRYGQKMSLNSYINHVFSWRRVIDNSEIGRFRVLPNRPMVALTTKSVEFFQGEACRDKENLNCARRAAAGECASSPGWMIMMCPKSCDSCHLRDPELRCARSNLNMIQKPAIRPGDLDYAFRAVAGLAEPSNELAQILPRLGQITVHSAPAGVNISTHAGHTGPWVLTIDNFLSKDEAQAIINAVSHSFSRSTDQGAVDKFGEQRKVVSSGRTSENAWCNNRCEKTPETIAVMNRIAAVTGVPTENYESFQVLRYTKDQYYRTHHDMSYNDNNLASGPRIYTFFLYLSDVEEGGHTEFPSLKFNGTSLKVKPKQGTALWWPSVQDLDPTRQDPRTRHTANPVIQGTKFAANAWIHLYDYREPNLWGCTGSFD
eukprot:CAMPEP_0197316904 /NCGR_PEP_ID=MMETSP0891-20130614/44775_1 /TAXON_ID=44058 ORGANISM="Aureoumbra lagunensis, Strain CCMP1510" /NCGR_SAMPLE_ID=MMETSP0891 /ASSEMBLY_ACC=CAM_ASM_000534 /LENGTH=503 /DNA_ID=CAMNT_0042806615 /DNA_START=78 /DNA_END=1589 /DNA_ORIENTATION=+